MASRPESLEPGTPLSGALPFSGRANTRLESNEQRETVQSAGRKCAMSGPRHAIIEYTLDVPNGHNNTCPFTNGSIDCSGFRRKRSRKTEMSILTNFFCSILLQHNTCYSNRFASQQSQFDSSRHPLPEFDGFLPAP